MASSIYAEYFRLTKEYQEKCGKHTIVLMQVGAFFEMYGLKNAVTDKIINSEIEECSQFCNLNVCEKKISYDDKPVVMSGFRDHQIEKYIQKLTENNYTAVVFVQEKNEKNTKRIFHSIHSAGTYISFDTDTNPQITNNIMCIWFELEKANSVLLKKRGVTKDNLICGLAVANIFTGKSHIFEHNTPYYSNPTTFDELERCMSIYAPSEIIVVSPFDKPTVDTIMQFCCAKTTNIHHVSINNDDDNALNTNTKKAVNCTQQKYITHILSKFHGEEAVNVCNEFQMYVCATQSYCFLLNFIQEHNPNLVKNIEIPTFNNTTDRVILANHTLKQLNIIDDFSVEGSKNTRKLSSVLTFLNKCCCSMGKRRFQHQLLNPTFNETWLSNEYEMTELMISCGGDLIQPVRKLLGQVCDVEKTCRQITIQKIYPSSIYSLFKSVENIKQIFLLLEEKMLNNRVLCKNEHDIPTLCDEFCDFIKQHLCIEQCKGVNSMQYCENNIIKTGFSVPLDKAFIQYNKNMNLLRTVQEQLNVLANAGNGVDAECEQVKIHETEKMGMSLQLTKKRGIALKKLLMDSGNGNGNNITFTVTNCNCGEEPAGHTHILNDIKFVHASTSVDEIDCSLLKKITKELLVSKEKINREMNIAFNAVVQLIEKDWTVSLEKMANYASLVDVLQCKSYIAIENNYVKPTIVCGEHTPFIRAKQLRHCLVEHLQTNEIYVPNDVTLDENTRGILLYGTNAVGKTSIIRALGISLILAQSGLFVPCSHFEYKPYTAIYSRILGNDNLFKGLSTFAVEMSELRTILKMADDKSLILGDELCSGTETESALSIFVAGLMDLYDKKSSFMFATHFHEIVNYDEITAMKALKCMHLSVHFDREHDCLVYDRKLKEGSGTRMYGLEVCKSLYLPEAFLENAHSIRNKYYPQTRGELSHQPTRYNSQKIRGMCEMCNEVVGEEIHHLREQREAGANGFIETFHKNHSANLMTLCQKCHDAQHRVINDDVMAVGGVSIKKNEGEEKPIIPIVKVRKVKTSKCYKVV